MMTINEQKSDSVLDARLPKTVLDLGAYGGM